jgi:hypothetical protein
MMFDVEWDEESKRRFALFVDKPFKQAKLEYARLEARSRAHMGWRVYTFGTSVVYFNAYSSGFIGAVAYYQGYAYLAIDNALVSTPIPLCFFVPFKYSKVVLAPSHKSILALFIVRTGRPDYVIEYIEATMEPLASREFTECKYTLEEDAILTRCEGYNRRLTITLGAFLTPTAFIT